MDIQKSVSRPTIRRLPLYMPILRGAMADGRETISSCRIAERLDLEPIQVRKDLASIGITGQPKVGFPVVRLADAIERFLGWNNVSEAFVIGAGNLGAALAQYEGFLEYGMRISALFDCDSAKIGTRIRDCHVLDFAQFETLVQRTHVKIAILTVPAAVAQVVADEAVEAGIRAIWNFTPAKLNVPDDVIVERVDLAASLAVLSSRLTKFSE